MSQIKNILAAAAIAAVGFIGTAKAATVTLTPVVTGYYPDSSGIGVTPPLAAPAGNALAGIYQVELRLAVSLSPTDTANGFTGFGNTAFNVGLPALHLSNPVDAPGWFAYKPTVRTAGDGAKYTDPIDSSVHSSPASFSGLANAPLWDSNDDIGPSGSDLQFIFVDVGQNTAFGASDPRQTVGESNSPGTQNANLTNILNNPISLGKLFVSFDGSAAGATLNLNTNSPNEGFSLHNNTTKLNTTATGLPGQTMSLGSVAFGVTGTVPEPTSLAFLAVGGLMAARRRRA